MPLLKLLLQFLPLVWSLVRTTEAHTEGAGKGADKLQTVIDAVGVILAQFPAVGDKAAPFLALVRPLVGIYVALANRFGWPEFDLEPAASDPPYVAPDALKSTA